MYFQKIKPLITICLLFLGLTIYIIFIGTIFRVWLSQFNLVTRTILSQAISFGIPFLLYIIIKKKNLSKTLSLKPLDIKNFLLIVAITFASMPIAMFISSLSSLVAPNVASDILLPAVDTYQLVWLIIAIGVTPAIFEEIIFRGMFYKELEPLPDFASAVIGGFLFGIIHFNFQQFSYAFALGILFAYFVHYTKSIWAPILSHFLFNSLNVVMIYLLSNMMTDHFEYIDEMPEPMSPIGTVITMGIFSLIMLPMFIFLMRTLKQRNQ